MKKKSKKPMKKITAKDVAWDPRPMAKTLTELQAEGAVQTAPVPTYWWASYCFARPDGSMQFAATEIKDPAGTALVPAKVQQWLAAKLNVQTVTVLAFQQLERGQCLQQS